MPQMSPQQQQMQREFIIRQGREMGQTLLKQKQLMEQIQRNRALREQARKTEELTLFFNYNDDILPINIKANKFIPELLEIYMNKSWKRDVKFFFKEEELKYNDTSARELNEIKGLVSGEEIIVKDIEVNGTENLLKVLTKFKILILRVFKQSFLRIFF